METVETAARRAAAARVLGVAHDASGAEIRRAYRAAVKRTHPDLHPTARIDEFVRVHAAFEDLVRPSPPSAAPPRSAAPPHSPDAVSTRPGSRLGTPRSKAAPIPATASTRTPRVTAPTTPAAEEPIAPVLVLDPTVRARIDRFVSVRTSTARDGYEHAAARRLDVVA